MANFYIWTCIFLSNFDEREKEMGKIWFVGILYTLLDFACPECGHIQPSAIPINSVCKCCAPVCLHISPFQMPYIVLLLLDYLYKCFLLLSS